MRTQKTNFWIIFIGLTLITAIGVSAQTNAITCPTFVQNAFTATELLCEGLADGQACLGNGIASVTPVEGVDVNFANPGDTAPLASIQRIQSQTINTESQTMTSILAKLEASTRSGEPQVVDMVIFGDSIVSSATEATAPVAGASVLPATIEAGGGVIVRQEPLVDSNNIWQLLNGESVQAIGRSNDNQWIRIIIPSPNGGAGWVFSQFISVEGGSELLPFHTNASPIPETSGTQTTTDTFKPLQAYRLESLLTDPGCAETPDSGVILQSPALDQRSIVEVNGVELRIRGTVFLTAQVADKMTVYNLEGETAVILGDSRVDMVPGTMSEVPMDAGLAPTGNPSDSTPTAQDKQDLFVFLPLRLLSRNFDVTSTELATDTNTATEQTAPPPPQPTEVPPVEEPPVQTAECPTIVQQSYTATEIVCEGIGANSACIGNAGVDAVISNPRPNVENYAFANTNDRVNSTDIDTLMTRVFDDPQNIWTSIIMTIDATTTTGATAQATLLVFGEVDLENMGQDPAPEEATITDETTTAPPPAATEEASAADTATTTADGILATVESPGPLIVKAQPRVDSETIGQLQSGEEVTALSRSIDQQWIEVQNADGLSGWAFEQFIVVEGGVDALPIVDPSTTSNNTAPPSPPVQQSAPPPAVAASGDALEFTSMQAFDFASFDIPSECAETSNSGILIQSPDDADGSLRLLINDVEIQLDGTILLRASRNENMNIVGLEGEAIVIAQGTSQTLETGKQTTIQLVNELEPNSPPSIPGDYSFENAQRFLFLPIRLLPRNFEILVPPEPADNIVVENTNNNNTSDNNDNTNTNDGDLVNVGGTTVDFDANCEISAGDSDRNLRADAGTEFDILNVLRPGNVIEAVSQKRGSDRYYWYETARGWIRSDAGIASPECGNLPLFGVIYSVNEGGEAVIVDAVAPVAPAPPPQPTSPPPPPVTSDGFGNVCENGGFSTSFEVENSGVNYVELGGVWTGQAGQSVTFIAEVPYFRPELQNILTFVNEDGSAWLGSVDSSTFTINFDSNRRFRVRVGALLGDFITLRVSC